MDLANTSEIQFPRKYIARDKPRKLDLLLLAQVPNYLYIRAALDVFSLCGNYISYVL